MRYFVIEIQKYADGTAATLVDNFDDINAAWSKFFLVLASAAVSSLPVHSAVLLNETGFRIESRSFEHPLPAAEE